MRTTPFLLALALAACDETAKTAPDGADSTADTADTTEMADTTADDTADAVDTNVDDATVVERCAPILETCLTRQRTCVLDDGEPECAACPAGQYAARPDGTCTALGGTKLDHDFGIQDVPGGYEIGSLCQTWVLDNDEELWVNAVEMDNDGYYHHSNWFFVPEDHNDWPTDPWPNCYDEGFHEIDAAIAGGVLYAQSTQVRHELQKFQTGAAVHIPPRSRIITVTHLLNFTPDDATTGLRLALYTIPRAEVTIPLTPAQLIYGDLKIPAKAVSRFGSTCDLQSTYGGLFDGAPLEAKLHYVLPHYHNLGAGFDLSIVGGPRDGDQIVALGAYSSDPFGFAFDPPIDLAGATGLSFGCTFDNPRDEVVRWGIGDQEMCEALLFFESPMAFSAGVSQTASQTTEGETEVFTGTCGVAGFVFDPFD